MKIFFADRIKGRLVKKGNYFILGLVSSLYEWIKIGTYDEKSDKLFACP